jgi:Holliday junction resolvase RusA-like endonuclease
MVPTFVLEILRNTVRDGLDWEPEHCGYARDAAEELLARRAPQGSSAAEEWYHLIAARAPSLCFRFDVPPASKGRPRLGAGGHTYTDERTRAAEEHLGWRFKLAMQGREPMLGNLAIVCVFYRPDRRRIDGDNMLKLVCDAGNQARVWGDDCQLTTKLVRVELDKARPRTEIAIGPLASSLQR